MAAQHVGSIIVAQSGYPIGIVTETDMTKVLASGQDARTLAVDRIMSSPLFSTSPDTDLMEVVNAMTANHIKKMPVVEHQRVIGIITQTDIIKNVLTVTRHLQEQLAAGSINTTDYQTRTDAMFRMVQGDLSDTKFWHMRCLSCGFQFTNEETGGKLSHPVCPRCGGQINYDLSAS
jgi:signal-transduction protein with cAMP-binding, CBS, and nucleotidyltransferase domain